MAICCFPLAEKTVFLSFTNFILSFAMALASGSLFFLLFPSCLEDRSKFTAENERLSWGFVTDVLGSGIEGLDFILLRPASASNRLGAILVVRIRSWG